MQKVVDRSSDSSRSRGPPFFRKQPPLGARMLRPHSAFAAHLAKHSASVWVPPNASKLGPSAHLSVAVVVGQISAALPTAVSRSR